MDLNDATTKRFSLSENPSGLAYLYLKDNSKIRFLEILVK